jgi:UDP-2-acetamido-3-amino-2,3-dideoxy-glucuronate N-acetyltransferase
LNISAVCQSRKLPRKSFIKNRILENTDTYYLHPSSFADEGCTIGAGTKVWHFCHIMGSAVIGERCNIGQNVYVGDDVIIGNNVKIQNNVSVYTGIFCEDDVFLGPSVVFTNIRNPRSHVNRRNKYISTRICKGATIGANATIVCGITIGRYAFIGAGTVVTRDVPDYALVTGNPGRHKGWMSQYGHKLQFVSGKAICPEGGQVYILEENTGIVKVSDLHVSPDTQ